MACALLLAACGRKPPAPQETDRPPAVPLPEKVSGAENDLFSSYNTYRWAVDYGIMN